MKCVGKRGLVFATCKGREVVEGDLGCAHHHRRHLQRPVRDGGASAGYVSADVVNQYNILLLTDKRAYVFVTAGTCASLVLYAPVVIPSNKSFEHDPTSGRRSTYSTSTGPRQ